MTVTTPDAGAPVRYDPTSIWLHWITAGLVLLLWCLGQTIDWFPKGTPRILARSTHISAGAVLGLIVLYRMGWRWTSGRKLQPAGTIAWRRVAAIGHGLLYLALASTIALGFANVWVRGDTLFYWFTVPAFDPGNKELRETVEDLHELSANTLVIIAGLHAAIGLFHHYVLRDATLRRMGPRSSGGAA